MKPSLLPHAGEGAPKGRMRGEGLKQQDRVHFLPPTIRSLPFPFSIAEKGFFIRLRIHSCRENALKLPSSPSNATVNDWR